MADCGICYEPKHLGHCGVNAKRIIAELRARIRELESIKPINVNQSINPINAKTVRGQTRESYNAYQREYQRNRRAEKKASR